VIWVCAIMLYRFCTIRKKDDKRQKMEYSLPIWAAKEGAEISHNGEIWIVESLGELTRKEPPWRKMIKKDTR
jgi:hypothetical protein